MSYTFFDTITGCYYIIIIWDLRKGANSFRKCYKPVKEICQLVSPHTITLSLSGTVRCIVPLSVIVVRLYLRTRREVLKTSYPENCSNRSKSVCITCSVKQNNNGNENSTINMLVDVGITMRRSGRSLLIHAALGLRKYQIAWKELVEVKAMFWVTQNDFLLISW